MKYLSIKGKVEELLRAYVSYRDNDHILITTIWRNQLIEKGLDQSASINQFAGYLVNGVLSNPESIRRSRQKLQEIHPELRGDLWYARHKYQNEVRKELKEF